MKTSAALRLERMPAAIDIDALADLIRSTQNPDGEIPWSPGDKTDPWDHVESAMGLTIAGDTENAVRAFEWMRRHQLDEGCWYSSYRNGEPDDRTRDTNMAAYIAVGLYHYFLITGDDGFLEYMWPAMAAALDFAVRLQAPSGEIYWAKSPAGDIDHMALLTGSSSVFMSLKCGIAIARILHRDHAAWSDAAKRLAGTIRYAQHRFEKSKARFSMDWFYPILAGAVTGSAARQRISDYWSKYVIDGKGVRCVSDEPWITIAETSELCLALSAMGDNDRADRVFGWLSNHRFQDGTYWCGFTVPDGIIWPEEKVTWTNAVVLMAADALYGITPAGHMFHHDFWARP